MKIFTECGCEFERGGWVTDTCEHGREFTQATRLGSWKLVEVTEQPTIICLCGSTRFYEAFQRANFDETMKGNIILSVGFYPHSTEQAHGQEMGITPKQKKDLDQLHFRKIDLADEVLILNIDGYIGESTARELEYAKKIGKEIKFLESDNEKPTKSGERGVGMELVNGEWFYTEETKSAAIKQHGCNCDSCCAATLLEVNNEK